MFDHRIRRRFNAISLALAMLLVGYWFLHSGQAEGQLAQRSNLRDLQEQRLATLREIANLTSQRFQAGQTTYEELRSALNARNDAELDLCTSNVQRIALLEKLVAEAKLVEEHNTKLAADRLVPETSLLKAKADRLRQEILLEQAKTK